jgi:predicted esterase
VPRGRRGIGPDHARDWWAWPTSPQTHTQLAASIVARIIEAKTKLEGIAGAPFERVYLAGSSNGAYFLTALAMRGDLDRLGLSVHGYGAMSGGATSGIGADALAGRTPRAFYIGYGAYDDESKKNAGVLEAAHWPVQIREHPTGHGARERYLDEAFEFWND